MIAIHSILLPVDFSAASVEALQFARGFQQQYDAELHVLHVVEDVQYLANTYLFEMPTLPPLADVEKERQEDLNAFVAQYLADSPRVTAELCCGKPFVEILRYAQEQSVDLIIIASHGRTGLEHALFGSTAEKVVRKSACPVLVVKPPRAEG